MNEMSERSAALDAETGPDSPTLDRGDVSSLDHVFDVLTVEHRRLIVERLADENREVAFETLVTGVAAEHSGIDPASLGDGDREPTRIALYHTHLPKLVDAGVIEFDRESGTVAPGPRLGLVSRSLNAVEELQAH